MIRILTKSSSCSPQSSYFLHPTSDPGQRLETWDIRKFWFHWNGAAQLMLTSGQSSRMRTIVLQSYGQQPLRITEGRLLMPAIQQFSKTRYINAFSITLKTLFLKLVLDALWNFLSCQGSTAMISWFIQLAINQFAHAHQLHWPNQLYGQQPLRITAGKLLLSTLCTILICATKLWSTTNTATKQGNTQ